MVSLLDQDSAAAGRRSPRSPRSATKTAFPALARVAQPCRTARPGPIAERAARIYPRYEDNLGAGSFIIEPRAEPFTATAGGSWSGDRSRSTPTGVAAATVLGWLGREALDAAVALSSERTISHPSIGEGLMAIGADAVRR